MANLTEPASYQDLEALPGRAVGIVRSPRRLFVALVQQPHWAGMMLTTFLVTAGCSVPFMQTSVGRQALVDQWERTALAFGREVDDDRYAEFVALSAYAPGYAVIAALAGGPVLSCAVAGMTFAFSRRLRPDGRRVRYVQVLAVVTHAGVVLALRPLVAAPLNYARETLASPTTLGHLLPMFDEVTPAARFLGAIDLFVVWWVIVLAIGIGVLYGRSARATVPAFIGVYVGFAALLAISMAVAGGAL
jgi:hypothetical protein